ncbi:MAG TPA: tetratricopeptide repeat protein [Pseudomonadales bacterium]|nr:tetratricopeptide repeat protein [Pseudomonadales bacterium]
MPMFLKLCLLASLFVSPLTFAQESTPQSPLEKPLVERYILDELKALRSEMAATKVELNQKIVDRELHSVDRGVAYATDTISYFFYLIAGASSILVLVGWSSLREIRERVHAQADEKISSLVKVYETRLNAIEKQLTDETRSIQENREEIERTREIQSLWMRQGLESNPNSKIDIYDNILKLSPRNSDALAYKADAALELGEPRWAANLARQALKSDPDNSYAYLQLACAYTALHQYEEAMKALEISLQNNDSIREDILKEEALHDLHEHPPFRYLMKLD